MESVSSTSVLDPEALGRPGLEPRLIDLIRQRPATVAELLRRHFDIMVPEFRKAVLLSADLTNVMPTEYRADAVIAFEDPDPEAEEPVYAVVVEVQLRPVAQKLRVWPAYVATVYARLGCPVAILVICPDLKVARWAASPISTGEPGLQLTTVALGPDQVPVVTTEDDVVDCPELAVLSALAHGGDHPGLVLPVLVASLEKVQPRGRTGISSTRRAGNAGGGEKHPGGNDGHG